MVHRLEFDLGLQRLAAAADGGGCGDYMLHSLLFGSFTVFEQTDQWSK